MIIDIKKILKNPMVLITIIGGVFGSGAWFYIGHLKSTVDLIKQQAQDVVIETGTDEISFYANKRIKEIDEINVTSNNNTISFDSLFE